MKTLQFAGFQVYLNDCLFRLVLNQHHVWNDAFNNNVKYPMIIRHNKMNYLIFNKTNNLVES